MSSSKKLATSLIILSCVAALAIMYVAGCDRKREQKQVESITIGISPWPGTAPLYVAQEKGFFKDEGLNVTILPYASGHLALDETLLGKVDMATTSEPPIVRAVINSKPICIIATVCKIDRSILIIARKDRGISSPGDLKGKKVGLATGSSAEYFFHIYLPAAHVRRTDVQVVNVPAGQIVSALLNGEVDAVSTWAPYTVVLQMKLGDKGLVLYDPDIYTMTWNIAATKDFVKNNPERVRKFLRAIVRAERFILERPAEARMISIKNFATDSSLYEKEWQNYHFAAELDQGLILNMEDQARWMIKQKDASARKMPNFLESICADGLKSVEPTAVRIAGK